MTTIIGRGDLAILVATRTNMNPGAARRALDAVFEEIAASTGAGNQVRITGFGSFQVKDTAPRVSRNPRTGEAIDVPAGRRLAFKPSRSRPV